MRPRRTVCWFSAGAASAVAAKLVLRDVPDAVIAYCETGAEHPDNERFLSECSEWFGRPIERLRSDRYADTWDVWEKRRYLAGIDGALCTVELKVMPRLAWQQPADIHVFGYTADANDTARAKRLRETYFEMQIRTPLIDKGITKESCLAMIERAGIALPPMYALGFQNNNCIPCVKATSPAYWALVRNTFPEKFERMAKLSRELDVRLCRHMPTRPFGKPRDDRPGDDRRFIDEIPADHPTTNPIQPACDFLCHIAEQDLAATDQH